MFTSIYNNGFRNNKQALVDQVPSCHLLRGDK